MQVLPWGDDLHWDPDRGSELTPVRVLPWGMKVSEYLDGPDSTLLNSPAKAVADPLLNAIDSYIFMMCAHAACLIGSE